MAKNQSKYIFNRYDLISIILASLMVDDLELRAILREKYSKMDDSVLLDRFEMFYCIRKGFYTTV